MPFDRKFIEGMRKPDIVLVGEGTDPVRWVDIISTIEVKWKDTSDLYRDAIAQLGDVAALVLHHQPDRQWFPCLSLCGTSLRMAVFTRGGSLHTVPLDLRKDVTLFSKVMNYFTEASLGWLGYDTRIFKAKAASRQVWDPDGVGEDETYDLIGKLFLSTGAFRLVDCCNLLTQLESRLLRQRHACLRRQREVHPEASGD